MRNVAPIVLVALTSVAGGASAQGLDVGDSAPPIVLDTWLNLDTAAKPTLKNLEGKVVMIEFWGTWCAPCVRAMPHVQQLHDRYGSRGLMVLAISYEKPAVLKAFLEKNAYTMPVGSDPQRTVVNAYKIKAWPSTFVIDKQGKLAYVGHPSGAEAALEKALGLESSPETLLTLYLVALQNKGEKKSGSELSRLMERATADFDLKSWAGAQEIPDGIPLASGKALAAAKVLTLCAAAAAKKDIKKRHIALNRIAASGPKTFDLAAWARIEFGKVFPIKVNEFKRFLRQNKFSTAVDAILTRNPPRSVLTTAAKSLELKNYCRKKMAAARLSAKKGIMIRNWVLGTTRPKDNDAFWSELSVSGMAFSKDRKTIRGVIVDGLLVTRATMEGFIQDQLSRAVVMESIAKGKAPQTRGLIKLVENQRQKIFKPLERRYGKVPKSKN